MITRSPAPIIAGAIATAMFAYAWMAEEAYPHDAPSGWSYEMRCCSLADCRQVPANSIAETPQGYVIRRTGEVIPYSDARIRDSKDEHFHWCSVGGSDTGKTLCLYRAPRGY